MFSAYRVLANRFSSRSVFMPVNTTPIAHTVSILLRMILPLQLSWLLTDTLLITSGGWLQSLRLKRSEETNHYGRFPAWGGSSVLLQ